MLLCKTFYEQNHKKITICNIIWFWMHIKFNCTIFHCRWSRQNWESRQTRVERPWRRHWQSWTARVEGAARSHRGRRNKRTQRRSWGCRSAGSCWTLQLWHCGTVGLFCSRYKKLPQRATAYPLQQGPAEWRKSLQYQYREVCVCHSRGLLLQLRYHPRK